MHDQPKQSAALLDPTIIAQRKKEEDALGELYSATFTKRLAQEHSTDALVQTGDLLSHVPEAEPFYNYRREILLHLWEPFTTTHTTQLQVNMLLEELKLNSALLKKNYKIYSAFTHRRWILEQLGVLAKREATERYCVSSPDSSNVENAYTAESVWRSVIAKELAQCELLLRADERNFHAWNYRRWVLDLKKKENNVEVKPSSAINGLVVRHKEKDISNAHVSLFTADELLEEQFTCNMIKYNFSNYSAWHQRALLLQGALSRLTQRTFQFFQEKHSKGEKEEEELERSKTDQIQFMEEIIAHVEKDAELLINAMYCDPNDQSAWFYAPYLHQVKTTVMTLIQTNLHINDDDNIYNVYESKERVILLMHRLESACDRLLQEAARVHVAQSEFADEKCFLPAYFVLSTLLITLSEKDKVLASEIDSSSNDEKKNDISEDVEKYAVLLDRELHKVANESFSNQENKTNDSTNDDNSQGNKNSLRLMNIVEYLYTHLMCVDEMRKGLYTAQRNQLKEILSNTE